MRSLNPESAINSSGLGAAFVGTGYPTEAQAVPAQFHEMSATLQYVARVDYAFIYSATVDRDKAME